MRILVSGAGMAGLSTGIALGSTGHDVTIVERANHLRVNGSPIDIRGDARCRGCGKNDQRNE